jgi:hypothetical protein
MFGKLAGAFIGNRVAGQNNGVKGALLGLVGARIARRGLGPLGTALALGYGAKKLYEWNRSRTAAPTYPTIANPAGPAI